MGRRLGAVHHVAALGLSLTHKRSQSFKSITRGNKWTRMRIPRRATKRAFHIWFYKMD